MSKMTVEWHCEEDTEWAAMIGEHNTGTMVHMERVSGHADPETKELTFYTRPCESTDKGLIEGYHDTVASGALFVMSGYTLPGVLGEELEAIIKDFKHLERTKIGNNGKSITVTKLVNLEEVLQGDAVEAMKSIANSGNCAIAIVELKFGVLKRMHEAYHKLEEKNPDFLEELKEASAGTLYDGLKTANPDLVESSEEEAKVYCGKMVEEMFTWCKETPDFEQGSGKSRVIY